MRLLPVRAWLILALTFALAPTVVFAADTNEIVAVCGDVPQPHSYTLAELQTLPIVNLRARDRDGTNADYTGVPIQELLRRSGAPAGDGLRGAALTKMVVVHAADGYQAAFSLAELDPSLTDRQVVLAWSRNNEPLNAAQGPLRLVVPDDKRPARWVRRVTAIEVVTPNRPAITNAVMRMPASIRVPASAN